MSETNEYNIKTILNKIDNIRIKGHKVEMKNKNQFDSTLCKTKLIFEKNAKYFIETDENLKSFLIDLDELLLDIENQLSKLSIIKFCKDKAEKYLQEKTERLKSINSSLELHLSSIKKQKNEEENLPLKNIINKLTLEINQLKKENETLKNRLQEKPKIINNPSNKNEQILLDGLKAFIGLGSRVDYKKAYEYFSTLCQSDKNNTDVKILLARMYEKGLYVDQSYANAYELYLDASENGNLQAKYMLGVYAENNFYGIKEDCDNIDCYEEAFNYYNEAAKSAYPDAVAKIGLAFDKGILHNKTDPEMAVQYYQKAIKIDNNPMALNGLGGYYFNNKNYALAFQNFNEAAKYGYPDAINNLGICYEFGKGVDKSNVKAIEYYEKASKFNHISALLNHGILLLKMSINSNSKKNLTKCLSLFLQIINLDNKHKEAYYYLGLLFEIGIDLFGNNNNLPNYSIAFYFYKRAAELGHLKAKTKYGIARYNGIQDLFQCNEITGIQIIEEAANQGDLQANDFIKRSSIVDTK